MKTQWRTRGSSESAVAHDPIRLDLRSCATGIAFPWYLSWAPTWSSAGAASDETS
ncbi:hypothetical protein GCM10027215_06120 [Nocardioides zeae]